MGVHGPGREGKEVLQGHQGTSLLHGLSQTGSSLELSASHPTSLRHHLASFFSPFRFQLKCHHLTKALQALKQPFSPSSFLLPSLRTRRRVHLGYNAGDHAGSSFSSSLCSALTQQLGRLCQAVRKRHHPRARLPRAGLHKQS